ncbi:hypothetical protein DRJ16_07325 [Candidatus Woesearchaeota archaeon]|nr:MAG: hypothetical protein DRJ16_07325 [Candidatus Woesearchaeota archaeon]
MNAHNIEIVSNYPFSGFGELTEDLSPDIIVNIGNFSFLKDDLSKVDYWFFGKEGEDIVYYEDRIFGMDDKILLRNLKEKTEIHATNGTLKIDRIYTPRSRESLKNLINTVIQIKQIEHGCLSIHASCLSKDGEAILLAAFPNVGKTLSAFQLLESGFKYISDDTVLVDNKGVAYLTSFPSAVGYYDFLRFIKPKDIGVLRYYASFVKSWFMHRSKLLNRILRPPHLTLGNLYETVDKAKVKVVCTLEIGLKSIKKIEPEDMLKKINAINEYCLPRFYANPFIKVYDYFNPGYIESIREIEREILSDFLSSCECYSLACNNWDWKSLLEEIGVI